MMDELLEEMIDPAPSREDAARRRRAWATGSILALAAVGVASLTTSALFTDQDSLTGRISTGTLVLGAQGATFDVPVEGLAPGGTVIAPVQVNNTGSLELRYAVSLSAAVAEGVPARGDTGSGDLRQQLRARVFATADCTGTVLGDTATETAEFGLPTNADAPTPIVGDPATGPQTGDRVLAGVNGTETLCVRVDMAATAGNEYQNTAADLTFRLDSEQTVNNP